MVDKFTIYKYVDIDVDKLDLRSWRKIQSIKGIEPFYLYNFNNVKIKYFSYSKRLFITGRFMNLIPAMDKVNNIDDVILSKDKSVYRDIEREILLNNPGYSKDTFYTVYMEQNLANTINAINYKLFELTNVRIDILNFKVSGIELCFNLHTEHVNDYITLFNLIYKKNCNQKYKNFADEKGLPLSSSFYIKTRGEFKNNSKRNSTVNFYSKLDQLKNREKEAETKKYKSKITDKDFQLAKNILRLEVQAHYNYLTKICKAFRINNSTRPFIDFLNLSLCKWAIDDIYMSFVDKYLYLGYCSYETAKKKIEESEIANKEAVLEYLLKMVRNNKMSDNTHSKYRNMLADLGIHHYLIPKSMGIDYLISPMKLLKLKVDLLEGRKKKFKKIL